MKNHLLLTLILGGHLALGIRCKPDSDPAFGVCNIITPHIPFTARLGETYCILPQGWRMQLGPVIEDSRCNHPLVDCVWAGRLVMAVTFDDGSVSLDYFNTKYNWMDTIVSGPYTIYLNKIYPETHIPFSPIDPDTYAFDMMVK